MFSEDELNTKIFIYDKGASNEDDAYKNVTGEAIVEYGKSLGFWLDRTAMKNENFSNMLAVSLHELTHKYGGDETSVFSYKLTDVMETVEKAQITDKNVTKELQILNETWKKI